LIVSITEVKHQDQAIEALQLGLQCDRLAHGYIFAGPAGVGKRTAAREFAKILLCLDLQKLDAPAERQSPYGPKQWFDSCGRCQSCRLVDAGTHPDYHPIYKELVTLLPGKERHKATELGIDVIREALIEKVALHPNLGNSKVFIVHEAHRLSRSAQNAMLKTLEEPPSSTYIILITERLSSLLPTIQSRAQAVQFRLLPDGFVRSRLAEAGAEPRDQRFFAHLAPGQLGLALELWELGVYDLNERLGKDLASLDLTGSDNLAQWIVDQGKELCERAKSRTPPETMAGPSESELGRTALRRMFGLIAGFYRDALRQKLGFDNESLINVGQQEFVDRLAGRMSVEQLQDKIESIREAQGQLDANVNQNLLVSNLLARLSG